MVEGSAALQEVETEVAMVEGSAALQELETEAAMAECVAALQEVEAEAVMVKGSAVEAAKAELEVEVVAPAANWGAGQEAVLVAVLVVQVAKKVAESQ
eukprot:5231184-Pleurochrysis_carterae.AAC.1